MLRWPLGYIPKELVVPVMQGVLRGKKWIVGSSNHGCWFGSYESRIQQVFARFVRPGDVVYDLGAHVGFHTLLASMLVGRNGCVFAFEPLHTNLVYLRRHLALNKVSNTTIVAAAVSDQSGWVWMSEGANRSQARVDETGTVQVRAVKLDDFVFQNNFRAPTLMKIDVEGAEHSILKGAARLLIEKRPVIILSTHGSEIKELCCTLLSKLGYILCSVQANENLESATELLAHCDLQRCSSAPGPSIPPRSTGIP